MIENLITAILAGFILHLMVATKKQRKKAMARVNTFILFIDQNLRKRQAKSIICTAIILLILGSTVLGTLLFTHGILNNKSIWVCLMAPLLTVGCALPLSSIVYKQTFK